jgi:formyltetrahydrofolate deformylase
LPVACSQRTEQAAILQVSLADLRTMTMAAPDACILTVTCKSERGQIAEISGFLAAHGCYISELAQFDDETSNRFFVRCLFRPEQGLTPDLEGLRAAFAAGPAARFPMEWALHDAATRSRVLLMVSRFDHCLNDLLYRHRTGELRMDVTAVVSNHPDLEPLVRWHGLPYIHLPVTAATKAEQEAKLWDLIEQTGSELVVLARYMQVLSDGLCQRLRGRAINIHHSFLPGFKGAKPYHRAFERGVKLIGATAHYVTPDLDEGPIIEQVVERVDHTLKPDDLVAVGRDSENLALARAVKLHLEHRVFINGNRTVVFR